MSSTLNAQVVDSVAATSTLVVGHAPAGAQAMVDLAAAHALGTLLHGAVHRHQQSAISGAAAATAACTRILAARRVVAPAPVPPSPPAPSAAPRASKEG
ncbi:MULTISPECIES: RebB family R body protein [unclassified Sphingomonas]|uniref:RebB family R body protein n=1 Tax=unclassified Sphingomonas TaxID=196159 RepID=UPI0022B3F883|nr:RebB family R body protein [Sphingomonas sp. NIBR02145]WHU00751.1 RebB family R body protein [Sphingomonas sp. NIBR02145]